MEVISQDELNQEIELKLQLLNGTGGEALWELPYVRSGLLNPPEEKDLFSNYYDTSEYLLLKQGFTLRVRNNKGTHTLTIKKMGNVAGGLHQRAEWNYPSPSEKPLMEIIEDEELREHLNSILENHTVDVLMTTVFTRKQSNWQDKDGNLLELAIDEGHIKTEKGTEMICEVELELKKGQTTALLTMGEQLALSLPMVPGNESKFYRGLQLLGLDDERMTPKQTHDKKQLPENDNRLGKAIPRLLQEAFYVVLEHYQHLCQKAISEDEIHKIRVSSRHVRSLLLFFKPALTKDSYKPLAMEFKSLAKHFAKLREIQVMNYHFHQSPCVGFCGKIEELIDEKSRKELEAMEESIKSGTLTPLVLRLWRIVMTLQVKERFEDQPVSLFAEERLAAWLDNYNRSQLKLSRMDINQLHQQRIRVKRIRYAAEWLGPFLTKKIIKTSKPLKEQQEPMGELHDIHYENIKLRRWIEQRGTSVDTMYQLGFYEGWQEKRKQKLWEILSNMQKEG